MANRPLRAQPRRTNLQIVFWWPACVQSWWRIAYTPSLDADPILRPFLSQVDAPAVAHIFAWSVALLAGLAAVLFLYGVLDQSRGVDIRTRVVNKYFTSAVPR